MQCSWCETLKNSMRYDATSENIHLHMNIALIYLNVDLSKGYCTFSRHYFVIATSWMYIILLITQLIATKVNNWAQNTDLSLNIKY